MSARRVESIKIDNKTINYLKRKIGAWNYSGGKQYPWREAQSEFHALIAEILLQRTKAEQVIPVYRAFIKTFPSIKELSRSSAGRIKEIILPLGLSWRSKKLKELGRVLYTENKGNIPGDYETLLKLPGVGPYSAAAFLSLHNNRPATIIDSNIIRLYGRFFGFKTDAEIRRNKHLINLLERITPRKESKKFNYSLLDLSRSICKLRPVCCSCPLSNKCRYNSIERER